MTMSDWLIAARANGDWYAHVIPLLFGRARLHLGHVDDGPQYRDGW